MSEKIENLEVYVAAIYYYLYRQAGCPFGNSLTGYDAWMDAQVKKPWEAFAEKCGEKSDE